MLIILEVKKNNSVGDSNSLQDAQFLKHHILFELQ